MTKLYVIGMDTGVDAARLAMMASRIADAGLEVVPVATIDDIPIPERERDDMVLCLSPEDNLELRIAELELTSFPIMRGEEYQLPDAKTEKKIRKAERRSEFRSKKDRRNHR